MKIVHSSKASVISKDKKIEGILDCVTEPFLKEMVEKISIPRHFEAEPSNNKLIGSWIADELSSFGYAPCFQGEYRNVIALPSIASKETIILIGAHYDSVPETPGADDNGSAIAALLCCAKIISERLPENRVCFAAFNREEDDKIGSADFVRNDIIKNKLNVKEAHILEMVGYCRHSPDTQKIPRGLPVKISDVGDFLGIIGNKDSNSIVDTILKESKTYLSNFPVVGLKVYWGMEKFFPHLRRSDHDPFWKARIPALMWTDTSEFRNPNYHQTTDTPETLDYSFLKNVTQLLLLRAMIFSSVL